MKLSGKVTIKRTMPLKFIFCLQNNIEHVLSSWAVISQIQKIITLDISKIEKGALKLFCAKPLIRFLLV